MMKLWVNFAALGNPTPDESLGFIWRPATADELQHLSLTPTPAMKGDTRREIIVRHSKDQWLHPSQISHYIKIRKYIDSWQSMKKTGIWKSAWNFVVEGSCYSQVCSI
ncbi:uncharacterized protein LOC135096373 isoform X3 [Scylla paramamosain]|uniref:uncharacterized protein LOC135096373 isoform X3 n=1 Tax=Scylla paramamosain TaxID=85552 RepID=UPI0030833D89